MKTKAKPVKTEKTAPKAVKGSTTPAKAKKPQAKKKKELPLIITPIGRIVFPHLSAPNSKGRYPSNKYEATLLFPKSTWKKEGEEMRKVVLKAGRAFYHDDSLKLTDFKTPFQDGDEKTNPIFAGHIVMKPKSGFAPTVVGPDKTPWDADKIAGIKGGDYVRCVLAVDSFEQSGGGITAYLNVVQFAREGAALGGGAGRSLELVDELEVELEDLEANEEEESSEDEEEAESEEEDSEEEEAEEDSDEEGDSEEAEDDDEVVV